MLECNKCGTIVPDAEQHGEGFSKGAKCINYDCTGILTDVEEF